ncbi:hypothetical protein [Streptosporangium sp. NPDC048865]
MSEFAAGPRARVAEVGGEPELVRRAPGGHPAGRPEIPSGVARPRHAGAV